MDKTIHGAMLSTKRESMAETLRQAERNLTNMPADHQRMVSQVRDKIESEPSQFIDNKSFRPVGDEIDPEVLILARGGRTDLGEEVS